jgi:ABC-type sulfate transport system permease subunit
MQWIDSLKTLNILALAALVFYFITNSAWLVWAALVILALASFDNILARVLSKGWLKFSEYLGIVMSKVVLTLVFYVFLVPVALLYRLFNKEISSHFRNKNRPSFFTAIKQPFSKKSFENPW